MTRESDTMNETTTPRGEAPQPVPPRAGWKTTLIACAAIVAIAAGITAITFSTEPTAEREGARRQTAMLAEVTRVERGSFRPEFVATGVVKPQQEIVLRPRVSGEIIRRAPAFTPGGDVRQGEVLLAIDPSDYRHEVEQRRGDLQQALTDLDVEMGQQHVAKQDYELLGRELPAEQEALVLRKPQLRAAKQRVEAARAAVARAELDLQRTTIRAPFDAHILTREVSVGSQVAPGDSLGRLVGVDAYWVIATVPQSVLRWLSFPTAGEEGSPVRVRNRAAWPEGAYRAGTLRDRVGALDEQTRMARVLIDVPDPLARNAEDGAPALIIEEFVEARLIGAELEDVVRLRREHVRDGDTVWVMDDERLRIVDVEVAVRDAEHAYITAGLRGDEDIVTSNLATVKDGAALRVEKEGGGRADEDAGE